MLATLSILTACQTTTNTVATDEAITAGVCSIFSPITWSSRDTAETIDQVRRHNAGRDEYCEEGP